MIVNSKLWEWASRRTRIPMLAGVRCRFSSIPPESKFLPTSKRPRASHPKQPQIHQLRLRRPQQRNHINGCRNRRRRGARATKGRNWGWWLQDRGGPDMPNPIIAGLIWLRRRIVDYLTEVYRFSFLRAAICSNDPEQGKVLGQGLSTARTSNLVDSVMLASFNFVRHPMGTTARRSSQVSDRNIGTGNPFPVTPLITALPLRALLSITPTECPWFEPRRDK